MRKLNRRNIAVQAAQKILKDMMDNKTPIGQRPMQELVTDMAVVIQQAMDTNLQKIVKQVNALQADLYPITYK